MSDTNAVISIREGKTTGTTIKFDRYVHPAFAEKLGRDGMIEYLQMHAKRNANRNNFPVRFWSVIEFRIDNSQSWVTIRKYLTHEGKNV